MVTFLTFTTDKIYCGFLFLQVLYRLSSQLETQPSRRQLKTQQYVHLKKAVDPIPPVVPAITQTPVPTPVIVLLAPALVLLTLVLHVTNAQDYYVQMVKYST